MNDKPTVRDVDLMLRILSRMLERGDKIVQAWGGDRQQDGSNHFPYPVYHSLVDEFIELAHKDCWCDKNYMAKNVPHLLATLGNATIDEIRSVLTYAVRRERFCDGHIGAMVSNGALRAVAARLEELRGHL